jgi:lipopolysaccharide export system ATP-binding protein
MALEAVDLRRSYGRREVVKGVSLTIARGEAVGLLGRNGAGKSTTFQMIAGLVTPDSGEVRLDGASVTSQPMYERARAGLTYLPQERSVFLKLTALENVLVPLEHRGIPRRERQARAEALLGQFGLLYAVKMKAYALSGGEARKLEVARALATDPRYILLDEPFAGMDPIHVHEVQDVVRTLKASGLGILLSDHNVYYAFEVIDRGYLIDAGTVLEHGTPRELATSPAARTAFLGEEFKVPPHLLAAPPLERV